MYLWIHSQLFIYKKTRYVQENDDADLHVGLEVTDYSSTTFTGKPSHK